MRDPARTFDRRHVLAASVAAGAGLLSGGFARAEDAAEAPPPFATDLRLPGLLHAVVARPPLRGGRLVRLDASRAPRLPGMLAVFELPPMDGSALSRLGGAAVIARDHWTAKRCRDLIDLSWSDVAEQGLVAPADDRFVPDTAEPLFEPPSATVCVGPESCIGWANLRDPDEARAVLAERHGLRKAVVTLHPTRSAAGPDRFSDPAYLFDAARLSRAMNGAPISLVWTGSDELPFRARNRGIVA